MSAGPEDPELVWRTLADQLARTRFVFLSLVKSLEGESGAQGTASAVQHQLEWAAVHMEAAVQVLRGDPAQDPEAAGPTSADGVEEAPELQRTALRSLPHGLRGHTSSTGIVEILGFLSSMRKSGTLAVHGAQENYLIELEDGAVVHAQGDHPPQSLLLGQILVAQGALPSRVLESFLARNPTREEVLGRGLLEGGLITRDALKIALAYQIQHLFHRVYVEKNAYFQFEEGVRRIDTNDIVLNVQQLLLETARSVDELDARRAG